LQQLGLGVLVASLIAHLNQAVANPLMVDVNFIMEKNYTRKEFLNLCGKYFLFVLVAGGLIFGAYLLFLLTIKANEGWHATIKFLPVVVLVVLALWLLRKRLD